MIDHKVSIPLTQVLARLAEQEGYAIGSTSEQLVTALINGRAEWLPSIYPAPLATSKRLHTGGAGWWHSMLYVHGLDWRKRLRREASAPDANGSPTGRRPIADHWANRSRRTQDGACLRPCPPLRALRACRNGIGNRS